MLADQLALAEVFRSPGSTPLLWTSAARCTCWSTDSHQPDFGHALCGGTGVLPATTTTVRGLFRSQGRWTSWQSIGELSLGEAELTLPSFDAPGGVVACKPNYVDHRVRDSFATPAAPDDAARGRVFFPAAAPVPFLFGGVQLAWRVQVQSLERAQQTTSQQ